jgi:hypothetical protein
MAAAIMMTPIRQAAETLVAMIAVPDRGRKGAERAGRLPLGAVWAGGRTGPPTSDRLDGVQGMGVMVPPCTGVETDGNTASAL